MQATVTPVPGGAGPGRFGRRPCRRAERRTQQGRQRLAALVAPALQPHGELAPAVDRHGLALRNRWSNSGSTVA
jgi:hypothetical protein